ncbi:MAG: hypothetical protein AB7T32_18495, partial [Dehalococcoidia bacterium]
PRFAGSRLAHPSLLTPIVVLIAAGLVPRAIVLPFLTGSAHDALLLFSAAAVVAANIAFALVIFETARRGRERDAAALAFVGGALFSLAASLVFLLEAVDATSDGLRTIPLLSQNAVLQLELDGFVLLFITGVSFRAIPTMVGIDRPEPRQAALLVGGLIVAVGLLSASLLYLEHVTYSESGARVVSASYAVFGLVLLGVSWTSGAVRSAGNRLRPASQPHLWLVRSAFAWMAVAGALAVYAGASGLIDGAIPGQFEFDAVRHSLGLGVITNLIAGMSLMIVPEFAAQRQHTTQRGLALTLVVLINAATLLRVAPAIAGTAWSYDLRNLSMAGAGTLAEVAVMLFAVSLIRLVRTPAAIRRSA